MKKRIIINNYNLYDKYIENLNIVLLSDIHFSDSTNFNTLENIKNKIAKLSPDYICIPGDIVDSLDYVTNDKLINNFYNWLYSLGDINNKKIPVLLSLGNHDMSFRNKMYNENIYNKYISKLNKNNVILLNNSIYEDDKVFIVGYTQPRNTFHEKDSLNNEINYFKENKIKIPNNNKYKIALIHSPINLTNIDVYKYLEKYNLILSGHMHNGMMLTILDKVLIGNYGLIDPSKKLFPKLARGIVNLGNNKHLIISKGTTKLSNSAGVLRFGNIFYPVHIEKITITNNIEKKE